MPRALCLPPVRSFPASRESPAAPPIPHPPPLGPPRSLHDTPVPPAGSPPRDTPAAHATNARAPAPSTSSPDPPRSPVHDCFCSADKRRSPAQALAARHSATPSINVETPARLPPNIRCSTTSAPGAAATAHYPAPAAAPLAAPATLPAKLVHARLPSPLHISRPLPKENTSTR